MRRSAWITGAGGLIGSYIVRTAPNEWAARSLTREQLELTHLDLVRGVFARDRPQLVIHCAALSKTLECERHPECARLNNIEVTRVLAELAADIPFFFFSTDLVFDGAKGDYGESDVPNPLIIYAETKLAAERTVLENPGHTVIRTSLNAGHTVRGSAFNEQWRAAWLRGETTNLFADEFRSPLAAEVTARAAWELVSANQPGLYHLGGAERLSRYEIGCLLAENESHLNAQIERGSIRDYANMRRSPDTSLNSAKIQRLLSFELPKFSDWLRTNPRALTP